MVLTPDNQVFQNMLGYIAVNTADDMLDQNVINVMYRGRQVALDKLFDCIDPIGVPPGLHRRCPKMSLCKKSDVVVSHFTGMFKPTKAFPHYLKLVQLPENAGPTCENTNH